MNNWGLHCGQIKKINPKIWDFVALLGWKERAASLTVKLVWSRCEPITKEKEIVGGQNYDITTGILQGIWNYDFWYVSVSLFFG